MKSTDYSRTVEVFKGSPWEAELVKGLLENNGIATIIKDGLMSTIAPYIAPDVTILVSEERYEDAMEIIRERDKGKDEEYPFHPPTQNHIRTIYNTWNNNFRE